MPLRVNTHVAPAKSLSPCPPTAKVPPSADKATEVPWYPALTAPVPMSLGPCWAQLVPLRVNTHVAPAPLLSVIPPKAKVLPSADKVTEVPWLAAPMAPVPTSLGPCWAQPMPLRVNTHVAPVPLLSKNPPTAKVPPSADKATEVPWYAGPTVPVPMSLGPCWAVPKLVLVTVKAVADMAGVPPVVEMVPVEAPGITSRRNEVLLLSNNIQAVPFTATLLTRFKLVPPSVTRVPTLPKTGEMELMV